MSLIVERPRRSSATPPGPLMPEIGDDLTRRDVLVAGTATCDGPHEIEAAVPGLGLRESRRFGEVPAPLGSRLPIHYRLILALVARLSPSARAYRLNLFDIQPQGIQ